MRKGTWVLGGYAVLATAGVAYLALRPPAVVEKVVEKRVEVPAKPVPPTPVEQAVAKAASPAVPYNERVEALVKIPRQINEQETARLVTLVENRDQPPPIRNDAVVALARTGQPLPGLGGKLVGMWQDPKEHPEWRMFCLQHMETVYKLDPEDQALLEKTLLDAATNPNPRFSGTAMMAITRLAKDKPDMLDAARALSRQTLAKAMPGQEGDTAATVTALQVARTIKDPAVLGQARKLAVDAKAPVMARLSALGVLGEMGRREDLPMIDKLAADSEPEARVRRVAEYARGKIQERLDRPPAPQGT